MISKRKNGLFIEKTRSDASDGIRFPEASLVHMRGFDVMYASSGDAEYHTVVSGEIWEFDLKQKMALGDLCGEIVSYYFKKHAIQAMSSILFVGLGNPNIISDSLGYAVSQKITPTSGVCGIRNVYSIPSLVPEITGFETASLVRSLKVLSGADAIVCADSLSARTRERLQSVIQISDTGICPGSAVDGNSSKICHETMGVPVISIGVPMAIYEDKLTEYESCSGVLLTRAECDVICDAYAKVIAHGLRSAFFRK